MKKMQIRATTIRAIMITIILVLTIATFLLFFLVQRQLSKPTQETRTTLGIDIDEDYSAAYGLSAEKQKNINDKILSLSTPKIDYQNQAIKDINRYASLSGVVISSGFSFTRPSTPSSPSQISFGNLTTEPVIISLANPVPLTSFIKFIKLIEGNTPLMQISGINISPAQDSKTDITTGELTIEVLTR